MAKIRKVLKDIWDGIKSGSGKLIPRREGNLAENLIRRPGQRVLDVKEVTTDKDRPQSNFSTSERASRPTRQARVLRPNQQTGVSSRPTRQARVLRFSRQVGLSNGSVPQASALRSNRHVSSTVISHYFQWI